MLLLSAHGRLPDNSRPICLVHKEDVHKYFIKLRLHKLRRAPLLGLLSGRTGSTSPTPCAVTTPCVPPLGLLSGRTGSTSTTSCAATTRLPATGSLHQQRRAPQLPISQP
jgi:hypothetical protein